LLPKPVLGLRHEAAGLLDGLEGLGVADVARTGVDVLAPEIAQGLGIVDPIDMVTPTVSARDSRATT
jgi:hypothetical protein